jgi:catechol 2,3-dioxygenase-like lactoylglutathione lyase family enzyme
MFMLHDAVAYATIPSKDMSKAREFYEDKLKLTPAGEMSDGSVFYRCKDGSRLTVFPSTGASDGSFTQLSFLVKDVEAEARDLQSRGVVFEEYDMPEFKTVNGIATAGEFKGGWFKDPDGNLISIGEGPEF